MGKNLRQQRRGKGKYGSPSHRYLGKVKYEKQKGRGIVVDILHAPGRKSPLAVVDYSGRKVYQIASEGMKVGDVVESGTAGGVTELKDVPEGSKIYDIELHPGDGGKLCRSSGSFATLITKEKGKCVVLLPSKVKKVLPSNCRATIGSVAGSGRTEKPFMKAGRKFRVMKSLGRLYPRVSGVAMNALDHPFGGSAKPGKHKTVSRHMPPGKKVGSISPRRMGKKKRG